MFFFVAAFGTSVVTERCIIQHNRCSRKMQATNVDLIKGQRRQNALFAFYSLVRKKKKTVKPSAANTVSDQ